MLRGINKKLLWIVVVWFAILQVFTPFIHAHVQADTSAYGHGLHMHDTGLFQLQDAAHTLKNVRDIQTIEVDKALVKSIDALFAPLFLVFFVISLLVISVQRYRYARSEHIGTSLFLHSATRPRAPPIL